MISLAKSEVHKQAFDVPRSQWAVLQRSSFPVRLLLLRQFCDCLLLLTYQAADRHPDVNATMYLIGVWMVLLGELIICLLHVAI